MSWKDILKKERMEPQFVPTDDWGEESGSCGMKHITTM